MRVTFILPEPSLSGGARVVAIGCFCSIGKVAAAEKGKAVNLLPSWHDDWRRGVIAGGAVNPVKFAREGDIAGFSGPDGRSFGTVRSDRHPACGR